MGNFAEKVEKEECNVTEWLESLTANSKVETAPGSIPASSGTVKPQGWKDEAVMNKVRKKR